MSNINELIFNEMQSLETMLDTFQQALVDPNMPQENPEEMMMQDPNQQMQPNDMQDPSGQQPQDDQNPDQSMVNAQLTQQQ